MKYKSQMKQKCQRCNKFYSKNWNLKRHMDTIHGVNKGHEYSNDTSFASMFEQSRRNSLDLSHLPIPSVTIEGGPLFKIGGGIGTPVSEEEEEEEDMTSNDGDYEPDDDRTVGEGDDQDDDGADDETEQEKYEKNQDENDVWDKFMGMLSFDNEHSLIERQEIFRDKLANFMVWLSELKNHRVFKKLMETVKQFRDDPADYGYAESIRLAVFARRFLLNDLVDEPLYDDADDDDDDDGDSSLLSRCAI